MVWLPLEIFIKVVSWCGEIKGASIETVIPENVGLWLKGGFALGYYAMWLLVVFHFKKLKDKVGNSANSK